jgi:hypothetical protein
MHTGFLNMTLRTVSAGVPDIRAISQAILLPAATSTHFWMITLYFMGEARFLRTQVVHSMS